MIFLPIISISLPQELIREIDKLKDGKGFSGRSDVLRSGLRFLVDDVKQKSQLTGVTDAVLLISHKDKHSQEVSDIRHSFNEIIRTQLHSQLENKKCFEIFVLHGDGKKLRELAEKFRISKKTDFAKLVVF